LCWLWELNKRETQRRSWGIIPTQLSQQRTKETFKQEYVIVLNPLFKPKRTAALVHASSCMLQTRARKRLEQRQQLSTAFKNAKWCTSVAGDKLGLVDLLNSGATSTAHVRHAASTTHVRHASRHTTSTCTSICIGGEASQYFHS